MYKVKPPTALEKLERAILSGQFNPRERLVETDLMARFGYGRTKIREGLKELEFKARTSQRMASRSFFLWDAKNR